MFAFCFFVSGRTVTKTAPFPIGQRCSQPLSEKLLWCSVLRHVLFSWIICMCVWKDGFHARAQVPSEANGFPQMHWSWGFCCLWDAPNGCWKWTMVLWDHNKLSYPLSHRPNFFLKRAVIGAETQIWLKCGWWGMMEGSALHKTPISPPPKLRKHHRRWGGNNVRTWEGEGRQGERHLLDVEFLLLPWAHCNYGRSTQGMHKTRSIDTTTWIGRQSWGPHHSWVTTAR